MKGWEPYKKFQFKKDKFVIWRNLSDHPYGVGWITMDMNGQRIKPWNYLGSRKIFKIKDTIFKVAIDKHDLMQNACESSKLMNIEKKDKKYFPQLLRCTNDGKVLIVKYIKRSWRKRTKSQQSIVAKLIKKYEIGDISSWYSPHKYSNWMISASGDPIILDIGTDINQRI